MATATLYAYTHCRGPLPVPPGKSSYCIKGDFYRHLAETVVHMDQKTGGGMTKLLEREGLRAFMEQRFLATGLYDNLPLPRVAMCLAELTRKDVVELTTKMGESSAERCMNGVYQRLLGTMTAAEFHKRFPSVIRFFYNYAPVEVTAGADGNSATLQRTDIPLAVAEWWCLVSAPFVRLPLEKNGAKNVDVQWKLAGKPTTGDVPLCDASWTVRWE